MKRVWEIASYSNDIRLRVFGAIAATIGFKLLDMTPGFLVGLIVDLIIREKRSLIATVAAYDRSTLVNFLVLAIVGAWAVSALFQYGASLAWMEAARRLQHEMRISLFRHVQRLPMSWLDQNAVGSTFEALNGDINQVEAFVSRGLDEIVQMVVSVSLLWIMVAFIDVRLLWCVVFPVPVLIVFIALIRHKVKRLYQVTLQRAKQLANTMHRHLMGLLDIKSLAQEDLSLRQMTEISLSIREANGRSATFFSALMPITKLIVICGVVSVLIYGGGLVIHRQLNAGVFTSVFFLAQRFLWPLCGVGRIVDKYSKFLMCLEHIDSIRNAPKEDFADGDKGESALQVDSLRLEAISFSYRDKTLFNDLSGEFLAGQITAIQGPSGVGKTTLSLCMLRLYNLSGGAIRIGGRSIEDIPLRELRSLIGYVPQNPQLFCGSLLENIALDHPSPDPGEITLLLESLGLHELTDKLRMPIGANASKTLKLSGGQAQRIAIARMLYRGARIMIFDEATSGLDPESETRFLSMLSGAKEGRIIIFISHRESIRRYADRVYRFQDGRFVKMGPGEDRKPPSQRMDFLAPLPMESLL